MKRFLLSLVFFISTSCLFSQNDYPQNYFSSPLNFKLLLSGTFGELRSDHFHTGIDIKTWSVEGAAVMAVADAYVSRVRVSAFGYGKTIYLTHPNGYVTVYGHLQQFEEKLADYVRKQQYAQKSFEVDLYLKEDQFKYSKRDTIALSGNSGGSGGPHLHFEIRDEKTQEPLNPLLFGFEIKDWRRPLIRSIRIYPIGKKPKNFELSGWGENYRLKQGDTIAVTPEVFFGINTIDKQNETDNNNGVYEVELFMDTVKMYGNRQDRLNFSTGRYINDFIDYAYYTKYKRRYQRSFVGDYNKLEIYTEVKNRGVLEFDDNDFHLITYRVLDANGNLSKLEFYAYADEMNQFESFPADIPRVAIFYPNKKNDYESEHVKLSIPANSLYDSLYFHLSTQAANKQNQFSSFQIHSDETPLQNYMQLSLKVTNIPEQLRSKVLIARKSNNKYISSTTRWKGDWATTSVRSFGEYTFVIDSLKPEIIFSEPLIDSRYQEGDTLKFTLRDDLSGIRTYNGFLNGNWVLFEYDAKNDLIFHKLESEGLLNENILTIELMDRVGNLTKWEQKWTNPASR